jgi:predicted O-methyltransferase YrrM
MTFIDADKPNIPTYFEWSLKLAAPGGLIVIDNVIRDGAVIDAASTDASVKGVRRLNELLRAEPRVSATTIQTVGSRGYDGFTLVAVAGGTS